MSHIIFHAVQRPDEWPSDCRCISSLLTGETLARTVLEELDGILPLFVERIRTIALSSGHTHLTSTVWSSLLCFLGYTGFKHISL